MITKILIPTAELAIKTGTPTNEAKAEIKTQPLTEDENKNFVQNDSNPYTLCYTFQSLYHYVLFLLMGSFWFHLFFSLQSPGLSLFVFKVLIYYFVILFIVIGRK